MPMLFPLLVGISGKRKFDKNDADSDREISRQIAAKFRIVFENLDRDFPETPKIVLTGLAFGADLLAAQVAFGMGSPGWAVAAILPFDRKLFGEDFRPSSNEPLGRDWDFRCKEHAAAFTGMLALADDQKYPRPRVIVRELPKLKVNGVAATSSQLSRDGNDFNPALRRQHYEQVGQFIAEAATIMIAVMPEDEKPTTSAADGGTARVVTYRRAGRSDEKGNELCSDVLRGKWASLVPPPGRFVWLIDPRHGQPEPNGDKYSKRYPVKVLPPLTDRSVEAAYAARHEPDLPVHEHERFGPLRCLRRFMQSSKEREEEAEQERLKTSLLLAYGFDQFNARSTELTTPRAEKIADVTQPADFIKEVETARSVTSRHQRRGNATSRRAFRFLAGLFVAAIFLFETFAKFLWDNPAILLAYIMALAAIGITSFTAREGMWQAVSEDYRAVSEMLRIQKAWWCAGLSDRVDREHLQGADRDLARVRDAASSIIAWLLVRRGWTEPLRGDWGGVRGNSPDERRINVALPPPSDWIGGQIHYFSKNAPRREDEAHRTDAASWSLFIASGVLAVILYAWLASPRIHHEFERVAHWISLPASLNFGRDFSFVLWAAFAYGVIRFRVWNRDLKNRAKVALTLLVSTLAAGLLALAAIRAAPLIDEFLSAFFARQPHHTDEYTLVVLLVTLSAAAGASRYLTERLNVEAEALEYRDARGRFERAEHALAGNLDRDTGEIRDEEYARQIVYELGRLALAENEAWLKSRRERPLTPVVG